VKKIWGIVCYVALMTPKPGVPHLLWSTPLDCQARSDRRSKLTPSSPTNCGWFIFPAGMLSDSVSFDPSHPSTPFLQLQLPSTDKLFFFGGKPVSFVAFILDVLFSVNGANIWCTLLSSIYKLSNQGPFFASSIPLLNLVEKLWVIDKRFHW
jgi:hypothetical protein